MRAQLMSCGQWRFAMVDVHGVPKGCSEMLRLEACMEPSACRQGIPGAVCFAARAASSALRCDSVRKLCEKSDELPFRASNSALVRIALSALQPARPIQELLQNSQFR